MPANVINGYEKFVYGCYGITPVEEIAFEEISHNFGSGFYRQKLLGSDVGVKSWKFSLSVLRNSSANRNVTIHGVEYTPAEYIWDLYTRYKVTGKPFIIESPRNNQHYLVRFANPNLSYERLKHQLWSTGIEFTEHRIKGESLFDISKMNGVFSWLDPKSLEVDYDPGDGGSLNSLSWNSSHQTNGNNLFGFNGGTLEEDELNGHPIVRLDGTDDDFARTDTTKLYQFIFVMKVRLSTFSGTQGIITSATDDIVVGVDTQTRFWNLLFDYETSETVYQIYNYQKNGIDFDLADQQAPMNTFAICSARFETGFDVTATFFGKSDLNVYSPLDFGDIIIFDELQPDNEIRELTQHLYDKYDLGNQ